MTKKQVAERMMNAVIDGWSFRYPKFSYSERSRHSLWVSDPVTTMWTGHKVNFQSGDKENGYGWISRLLDEAEVPK
tara:strand:- start:1034 stop:1261 length:228 start_codon:yes stop_codon:yes gene_type:complete